MSKLKRRWIELDYNQADSLRAQDVPYDGIYSVKDKLDAVSGAVGAITIVAGFGLSGGGEIALGASAVIQMDTSALISSLISGGEAQLPGDVIYVEYAPSIYTTPTDNNLSGHLSAIDSYLPSLSGATWDVDITNQPTIVSQIEAEAGSGTVSYMWTPERIYQAIAALGGDLRPDFVNIGTLSGTYSVNGSLATTILLTLNGNTALAVSGLNVGQSCVLHINNSSSYTITYPTLISDDGTSAIINLDSELYPRIGVQQNNNSQTIASNAGIWRT